MGHYLDSGVVSDIVEIATKFANKQYHDDMWNEVEREQLSGIKGLIRSLIMYGNIKNQSGFVNAVKKYVSEHPNIQENAALPIVKKKLKVEQRLVESAFEIKLSNKQKSGGGDFDNPEVETRTYDVFYKGKKVGSLEHDDYFGYLQGKLFGKDVSIRGIDSNVKVRFDKFVKSTYGQNFLARAMKKESVENRLLGLITEVDSSNEIFDLFSADKFAEQLQDGINAPVVRAQVSTLGGTHNISILILISLDAKKDWQNGILENSRYGRFHLYKNGVLEMFSGGWGWQDKNYKKFRKSRVKDVHQALTLLNKWVSANQNIKHPLAKEAVVKEASSTPQLKNVLTTFVGWWNRGQGSVANLIKGSELVDFLRYAKQKSLDKLDTKRIVIEFVKWWSNNQVGGAKYTDITLNKFADRFVQYLEKKGMKTKSESVIKEAWSGWDEKMPVQVVGAKNGKFDTQLYQEFPNLAAAQKVFPDLSPDRQGKRFTWGMKGRVNGKDAIRFETWDVEKHMSA